MFSYAPQPERPHVLHNHHVHACILIHSHKNGEKKKRDEQKDKAHTTFYRFHKFISSSSFPKIPQLNQNQKFVCLSICQPWPLWAGRQGKPSIWRLDKKHWVFGRILLSRSTDPTQALRHRASITFCQLRTTSFEPESNNILHWRNKTSNKGLVQSKSTVITDVCTVYMWLARVIASLWLSIVLFMVHIHSKDRCLCFYILHLASVALNLIWCQVLWCWEVLFVLFRVCGCGTVILKLHNFHMNLKKTFLPNLDFLTHLTTTE